jgi:hypothetical protein
VTGPKRSVQEKALIALHAFLLLALLPLAAAGGFHDQFGWPFAYVGGGLGALLGVVMFWLQSKRWRR